MPLLYVSAAQINFQCPNLPADSFHLVVDGEGGRSKPYKPHGLCDLESSAGRVRKRTGSDHGGKSGTQAMTAATAPLETPVQPNDSLSVFATGLGR